MGYAEDKTEEELIGLERAITREYRQAYKSVQMKAAKYFGIFEERDKKMREALKDGTYPKLEGASAWMTPEEHYKQWRLAQIGRGKRWEAVRDDLADSITKANEMAANIVNKKTAGIFGFNYNFSAYEIEKKVGKGVAFNIYNEHAVKELLEGKNHTEFRVLHVNRKRDYAWNQKKVQAALTSGILQGQSVPELTDAFLGVMGSNRKAAIRNARTAVTSAQNAGAIGPCKKLQEMGIEVLLQWRSAHDGRVRDSHAHLDGIRIKPGETFPNGCRYPGDPQGRGGEVYNCRCTLIKILPKYNGDTIESKNTEADYKAWLEGKKDEWTKSMADGDKIGLQEIKPDDKMKVQDKISEINNKIDDLKHQFSDATEGYSYDDWFSEFDSIEDGFGDVAEDDESFIKLSTLDQEITDATKQKSSLLAQKEKRGQLDTGYSGKIPDEELDKYNAKAFEQIKLDTAYSGEKAEEFHDALKEYFGGDYDTIISGETKTAKIIRDGLDRMPTYDGSVYRGLCFSDTSDSTITQFINLKPGDKVPSKGILSSWSSNERVAEAFGAASTQSAESSTVILECVDNKTGVGVQHLSKFGDREAEVLSSANYEVLEVVTESKYDYVSRRKDLLYFPDDLTTLESELKKQVVCVIKVKEV